MGYRSEVALAVGKDVMAQFLTTLAKVAGSPRLVL